MHMPGVSVHAVVMISAVFLLSRKKAKQSNKVWLRIENNTIHLLLFLSVVEEAGMIKVLGLRVRVVPA